MRAEIEPNSTARTWEFPPALARLRTVAVVVRFEMGDFAKRAIGEHITQGEIIRVPPATLKSGKQPAVLPGQGDEFRRFRDGVGEGLIDHDMLAGVEGFAREIEMCNVRRGDHDQINFRKS